VLVEDTTSTLAEGLATRTAFELPQQIMRDQLDDFVLVTEEALRDATRLMISNDLVRDRAPQREAVWQARQEDECD